MQVPRNFFLTPACARSPHALVGSYPHCLLTLQLFDLTKEVVRANKAKSLLRFRNSGDCSGKQSKAHRAAPVCFALHSKQSERLVGLLQKANKPKPLLLLHFQEQRQPGWA